MTAPTPRPLSPITVTLSATPAQLVRAAVALAAAGARLRVKARRGVTTPLLPFMGEARPGVPAVKRLAPARRTVLPVQSALFFDEVERLGAQFGAALAKWLTEEFIRDELPGRIRAEMTRTVGA
ncbi:hypothetical protein [Deinococcus sp.]|uniref:hypothetical protein n=1 Tax=Deinococcus sp. TaxID=47478 RepID=UPI0025E367B8|nr:hypothetical protein [Deinococcus sp.]